jgi:hypothetical protein
MDFLRGAAEVRRYARIFSFARYEANISQQTKARPPREPTEAEARGFREVGHYRSETMGREPAGQG